MHFLLFPPDFLFSNLPPESASLRFFFRMTTRFFLTCCFESAPGICNFLICFKQRHDFSSFFVLWQTPVGYVGSTEPATAIITTTIITSITTTITTTTTTTATTIAIDYN